MVSFDTCLHIIVVEMIVILAIVRPYMENKAPKQIASKVLLLLVGFMLVHITTHLLPNKIASFIYSSYHEVNARKQTRG
jgi:tyrosine-protein phosphatase YwqE